MKFKIDTFLLIFPIVSLALNGAIVSATASTSEITCNVEEEVCHGATAGSSSAQKEAYTPPSSAQEISQCPLYVAESSIPNAGLGIYSSVPLAAGSDLGVPELVLTHIDLTTNCKMSKLFTEEEANQWKDVVGTKADKHDDLECALFTLQGECELNPTFMLDVCMKSSAIHNAGLDVKKGFILMKDSKRSECEAWAKAGECTCSRWYGIVCQLW